MTDLEPAALLDQHIQWRGIRLERKPSRRDETDRFETPLFGPDPVGIWLTRSPVGQWTASLTDGVCAYGWSVEEAMEAARLKGIDSLLYQAGRLRALVDR